MPGPCVFGVLALLVLPAGTPAASRHVYTEGKFGPAELRYVNGLPVLTVYGTPEEMGRQIGALTARPLKRLVGFPQEMLRSAGLGFTWQLAVAISKRLLPQFPDDYRREMEALAKEAGLDPELLLVGNTMPEVLKVGGCSALIVGPARSAVSGPLFGRNLDYPTLGFLQDYSLVTVYHPKGKRPFVSIGFPGMIGCLSGINDAGLAVATLEVYRSRDSAPGLDPHGVPYTLAYRRLLEECSSATEAEKLLRSVKRTTMNNLAVCDRNGGVVFEFTAKSFAVRGAEDGLCACTNHFRVPDLAPGKSGVRGRDKDCPRYAALVHQESDGNGPRRLGLQEVARRLDAANQGPATLQTMIFEPVALRLHLAIGPTPTSALPLKLLELGPLLGPSVGK